MAAKKKAPSRADRMADLRRMTPDELVTRLAGLKKEQFNMRFQVATNQLEKTHRIRDVRREIAVVKTTLREKARAAAAE